VREDNGGSSVGSADCVSGSCLLQRMVAHGGRALALASGRVFGTQQRKGDNNLYPAGGNVLDKAGDEESPGSSGLAFRGATTTATALWGSVMWPTCFSLV
jgi:hypothetical protein